MGKHAARGRDLYSEIFPASSATIIGAGLITMSMGVWAVGAAFVAAGICLGIMAPVARAFFGRRI